MHPDHGRLRAVTPLASVLLEDNPSPMTLDGTNTYVVARWVVDPGPDDEAHLRAVLDAADGSIEGIVLTHDHFDHAQGAPRLASMAGGVPVRHPGSGDDAGPFTVVPSPEQEA